MSTTTIRERTPFHYNQIAIEDFFEAYPVFRKAGKMQLCSCIHYPLADLELELLESSSEEFETIEHAILELIYSGIKDIQTIANMMGLPEKFVKKIIILLEGYGHLEENMEMTALGKKSISKGVKYTKNLIRQKVQADPIFGNLITKEMYQHKSQLLTSNQLRGSIPIVEPDPFVEKHMYDDLFADISKYKKGKKKLFHMNAEKIQGVISKKLSYAFAFLVKFQKFSEPVVLLKCKKTERMENARDAFYWKPVAISKRASRRLNITDSDLNIVDDDCFSGLVQLAKDIKKQLQHKREKNYDFPMKVENLIRFDFKLDPENVRYELNDSQVYLTIDPDDFEKLDKYWLKSMFYYDIKDETGLPFVRFAARHIYPGLVCYAKTVDEQLLKFIQLVRKHLANRGDLDAFYEKNQTLLEREDTISSKLDVLIELLDSNDIAIAANNGKQEVINKAGN